MKNAMNDATFVALFAQAAEDADVAALLIESSRRLLSRQRHRRFPRLCARARRVDRRSAGHALHLCAGALRQAAGRRRRRAGGRPGDDAVLPLRSRLRQPKRALPHAVRRSRPGAGSGLVAARAAALRPRARQPNTCCSASRSTPRRRGPAGWSTPSSTPPRCTPTRSPRPRRSPPSRVRRCWPPRRLIRGDEAAVLARMDEEVKLFEAALKFARGARRVHGVHEPAEGLDRVAVVPSQLLMRQASS